MELPTESNITSHRPIAGKLIVAYKKLVKLLIAPYLKTVFEKEHQMVDERFNSIEEGFGKEHQMVDERFNSVDERFNITTKDILKRTDALFVTLDQRLETLDVRQDRSKEELGKKQEELSQRFISTTDNLEKRQEELGQRLEAKTKEIIVRQDRSKEELGKKQEESGEYTWNLSQELTLQKRRLDMILSELRKKLELDNISIKRIAEQKEHILDHSYFIFENRFRGSREEITKRQEIYLPVFKEVGNKARDDDSWILDIGCGRGELLELFNGTGIPAKGIDLNEDMVYFCKERGLQVEQADAISYLEKVKNEYLAGIIACQFIEHLPINMLIEFVKLCYSKTKKGGKVVFETINPESLFAMKWFYLDMSHQKLIHPQAISFLMESVGFYDIEVKYLAPVPEELKLTSNGDKNIEKLNGFLFGNQEYAVIATR